jgi:hypothetical protein
VAGVDPNTDHDRDPSGRPLSVGTDMTSLATCLRLRSHAPLALCAATALALLAPIPAAARSARSAARPSIARESCHPKRRTKSSKHGRGARVCAKTRTTGKTPAAPARSAEPAPLEVTSLYSGGGPAPVATPPAGDPTPAAPNPPSEATNPATESAHDPWATGGVTTDPIDPKFLAEVPFGTRSFWVEPWRAYLDTWPASRLLESVGINFDVNGKTAEPAAQLLQDSGFKEARIGINWHSLSYSEPSVFWNEAEKIQRLTAMKRHGLRPLIVLDAESGAPAPSKPVTLTTLASVPAGAKTVMLSPESAASVIPGKTGFNGLAFGGAPDILISSVTHEGLATLSKPLPAALPAGAHTGATLLYAPFAKPTLGNGSPNPLFQETLAGWLHYVSAVTKLASKVVGPGGYDLEVWNELSFGSQFLNAERYYTVGSASEEGCPEAGSREEGVVEECESEEPVEKKTVSKEIIRILFEETIALVRNPANGIPASVGISDGFASQTPFPSGANAPVGLTALSKHPYAIGKEFPAAYTVNSIRPINALGQGDRISKENPAPQFIPNYEALFPEFRLSSIATETLVRDIAPMTTEIYGFPHGREVGPVGSPPIQKWVTEYNLGFKKGLVPRGPDGVTPQPSAVVTPADRTHFHAKALLRSLVSSVNKGISRMYFYAAASGGQMSMISEKFMSAATANPSVYPGDQLGGEVMDGFHNLLSQLQGPGLGSSPARQLQLLSIAQAGSHAQFQGDGTAAHPSLYDREVLAVLPFQTSPTSFTIPVYVMTRDLLTLYEPGAASSNIRRFDLPDEKFRITLGNLPASATAPTISAYDPLRNERTPARLVSQSGTTATIELAATDYPRMLNISYPGS